jgi:hypothetical protein
MSANLAFYAADTLGVTLYQVKAALKASEMHTIRMGPWRIEMQIDVDSDIVTGTALGLWVTLAKRIRMYLIVREKANWLFVLDEEKLKACGQKTGFASPALEGRVQEFKPALVDSFHWREGTEWTKHVSK